MRTTELAYFAGIIDGEGSINLFPYYGIHHKYGRYLRYRSALSVSNTNYELMSWIVTRFGGKIQTVKRARDKLTKYKTCYLWMVTHKRAAVIITAIRPYLVAKAKQADFLLKFQATAKRHGRCGAPIEVQELRQQLAEQMSYLNRRGPIIRRRLQGRGR